MKDVCFTGHRNIDPEKVRPVLAKKIEELILDGSDVFYAGGAIGFDTLAAQTVIDLKESLFPWVSLVLILPCPPEEQTHTFSPFHRDIYYEIFRAADDRVVVSPHYNDDCMRRRNQELVDRAEICLCCYNERLTKSGTGQTVRMAQKRGISVINLFDKIDN